MVTYDVVSPGESMVALLPVRPDRLVVALARLGDEAWGRLRLGPGRTAEAAEVATP